MDKSTLHQRQYNILNNRCYTCKKVYKDNKSLFFRRFEKKETYTTMNIFGCCYTCHMMIRNFDLSFFLSHCNRIVLYNRRLPLEIQKYPLIDINDI